MHVLLQLKSYSTYIDMLLVSKKQNDWDTFLLNLKENQELENVFKTRMIEEPDFNNINFVISKLWNDFKVSKPSDNSSAVGYISGVNFTKNELNKNKKFLMKFLTEIIEILYASNKFMIEYIETNKSTPFLNLIIIIYVSFFRYIIKTGDRTIFKFYEYKLNNFIEIHHKKLNMNLVKELLKNCPEIILPRDHEGPDPSFFNIISNDIERLKIPIHWKLNEMYNCFYSIQHDNF